MNKILALFTLVLIGGSLSAKKVKFAVDMTGQTINSSGMHIVGDFQAAAGLGADWDPATAHLAQEGTTNIYSIIVSIPAFKAYQYKFVNGDITYESEVVPEEARVDLFTDNRWLYVDSLSTDTLFVGAIVFSGNAPSGKSLIRYKVNMGNESSLASSGIHVGTTVNSFDPAKTRLYSFGDGVYEIINYVSNGAYSYKYFNGNTAATAETVPSACATSGSRTITVTKDTVLPIICFATCAVCIPTGIKHYAASAVSLNVYPNPASGIVAVQTGLSGNYSVTVSDQTGRLLITLPSVSDEQAAINVGSLQKGIYFVKINHANGQSATSKLIVN